MRARATYLRDSLLVWQSRRNLEPDLARLVKVELAASDGMVLLSGTQAATLHASLDDQDPVGTVTVSVDDGAAARRPFGPRDLLVNGRRVLLPEAEGDSWTVDALPAALLLDLGWLSQPTGAHREAVPWTATGLPMAMAAGAAAWSARRARRRGRRGGRAGWEPRQRGRH